MPYRPPQADSQQTAKPTLEQLRSSFSPPDEQPINCVPEPYNFGMTATGSGLGFHGPAAFTSPILPQAIPPNNYQNLANGHYTAPIPAQQHPHLQFMNSGDSNQSVLLNGINGAFNYVNYIQNQSLNHQLASYGLPPTFTPTITPEVTLHHHQSLLHVILDGRGPSSTTTATKPCSFTEFGRTALLC